MSYTARLGYILSLVPSCLIQIVPPVDD